jgi:hypothetical protein
MVAKGWTEKGKKLNNMLGGMNFRVCIFLQCKKTNYAAWMASTSEFAYFIKFKANYATCTCHDRPHRRDI